MNRLRVKKRIIGLLQTSAYADLEDALSEFPENQLLNALFSCLCHPDEQVRWHAVSAFGLVVPVIAERDMEAARVVMRRFLWMLNDESGGIGWGVPEAMAEVMYRSRPLADEYLHLLVSYTLDDGPVLFQDGNFIELELLQEGVLWGLCRLADVYRQELITLRLGENLDAYFQSSSSTVRGLACKISGQLQLHAYRDQLARLSADQGGVRSYRQGKFCEENVASLAEEALARIKTMPA